ncbi:MAG: hypothetical protein ACRBCJ_09415 [Hyphomicrobiaceae bacterium]
MANTISIASTRAKATLHLGRYKTVLAVVIIVETVIAILLLINPELLHAGGDLQTGATSNWIRATAANVLFLSALQYSAYLRPIEQRLLNVIVILGRIALAFFYFFLDWQFIWIAVFETIAAASLYFTYRAAIISELQTRP